MPSKTKKQAKAMRAAKHSAAVRKAMGISKEVAEEFVEADKKKKRKSK
jgi:hypothetical protein